MKVNIHLHLTEKERRFLQEHLGEKYIDVLVKECIDISKMKLCVHCNKWYSRTSIKRHNGRYHNKSVITSTM
jgi:hypothetical protein